MTEYNTLELIQKQATITMELECPICGMTQGQSTEDIWVYDSAAEALDEMSKSLYDRGWRYGRHRGHGVEGLMCAVCYSEKDTPQ